MQPDNKKQFQKIFADLAVRAKELEEHEIAGICFAVAGAIAEESELELSNYTNAFVEMRMKEINEEEVMGGEDSEDNS